MKKKSALFLALVCSLGVLSGCGKESVPQQEVSYNMTFVNETGQDVSALKIRPTEDYDWTNNLLQKDIWKTGYEVPVSLNGQVPITENGWQVQMTFTNGSENIWEDVTLKDADKITFTMESGQSLVTYMDTVAIQTETQEDMIMQNEADTEANDIQQDNIQE